MQKVLATAAILVMAFAGQGAASGTASGTASDGVARVTGDCVRHPQGTLCGGLQNKTSRPQIAYIVNNGFRDTTVPAGRGTNPNIDYDGFAVTGNCTARATSVRYIRGLGGPSYNYTLVNSGKRYKFRTDEIVALQGLVCR